MSEARARLLGRHASLRSNPKRGWLRPVSVLASLLLGLGLVVAVASTSQAADPCTSGGNAIACENSKTGSPSSEWEIGDNDGGLIEGYTSDISTNVGGTVNFKIHSSAAYTMDVYRMGYYGGDGARKITSLTPNQTVSQANTPDKCLDKSTDTGLVDCGTWGVSASWTIPTTAVSGIYFAHITQTTSGRDNHVMFVVRNDASRSDVVFQTSDTTWQAYNNWGGNSLYAGQPAGRAYKVSYNRPFNTRGTPGGRDFVWANEYPMVRFLEAQGYDLSYISGIDTDRAGSLLMNHKTFLSVGHDEYWSGQQRANVEAARSAGVNLAFFSANEVYWKTRYEPSIDGSNTAYRTLVTYKETADGARTDPQDLANGTWTGTWRDPRFSPPADGGRPENNLTGQIFTVNSGTRAIKVPAADGKMRFWRNTTVASQAAGATYTTPTGTLGYEWDEDLDNGFRPAGAIKLSTANWDIPEKLIDYGQTVVPGNATHSMTLYRASSGALVFGAGTVQWSWGLDANHDGDETPTDPAMRQATVNLLADMSAQPTTLQSGLTAAAKSTDTTPPTSTITSPAAGASIASGSQITVTGTASDVGGQVGGVEVSLDAGATWHPATGRASWSYTGSADGVGATTIQVRASDDSANMQTAPTTRNVNVSCPCRLFGAETPTTASENDNSAIEAGVRFKSTVDGYVTGVTFYKGAANTGTHTGSLWSSAGTKLATGTFTAETATGWQTMQFTDAVRIDAGQTYIASYYAPTGGYATTAGYFTGKGASYAPLTAPASTTDEPNGVYRAAAGGGFPNDTFRGGNYWVSPIFDTVAPPDFVAPSVVGVNPVTGASSVRLTTAPTVGFSEPIKAGTLSLQLSSSAGLVAGTTTFDSARKVATFTPTAPLSTSTTYTVSTAGGTDDAGNALPAYSSTFKTVTSSTPGSCPCTIWSDSDVPATPTVNDASSVELGLKFTASDDGFINGVRFYKGPQNVGSHTGTLWSSTGTQLATTTFVNESTTGWQEALFSTAVAVTAGTTYVVSYHTGGFYSASAGLLANAVTNGPLTALASSASGGNGVYGYGNSTTFPTGDFNSTWYGVDVVYDVPVDITAPGVTLAAPGDVATSVPVTAKPTVSFSEKVISGLNITLKAGSTTVPSSFALDTTGRKATITPGAALLADTKYTVTVTGAADKAGNVMAPYTYSFTTSGSASCPCSIYPSDYIPGAPDSGDAAAIEAGVRFTPSSNGFVTAIRFYKGTGNTGTHIGKLWSNTGALLSSATFTAETATGWQVVRLPAPVPVSSGVTYVASYSAPAGHYSADAGQFASAVVNAPLTAPADGSGSANGVYGTPGLFPNNTFGSTGYGVDVQFATADQVDTVPPGLNSTSPTSNATSVAPTRALVAMFNEALNASTVQATVTGPAGAVASSFTVGADNSVTVTPTAALDYSTRYTVSISGSDLAGNVMTSPVTWSFTTARAATTVAPYSLFTDESSPSVETDADGRSIELGVKFSSASAGYITGLRFFKGAGNTGTHVGTLWSSTGTELAKATFTAESAAGWQEVTFEDAVAITADTTYVASYHANNGGFSVTDNGLVAAVARGPLTAPAGSATTPNGLYQYGDRAFPTGGTSSNYWVDVLFDTVAPADVKPPTVTAVTPADAATLVATNAKLTAVVNEPVTPASAVFTLKNVAGAAITGATSYDATTRTATFTPGAALAADTAYTATFTATDLAGNALTPVKSWTFRTKPTFSCPCTLLGGNTPTGSPVAEATSVELGVRVTPLVDGYLSGVRFYKSTANSGTHTGSLWNAAGTRLATGTFLNETDTGWQTLTFATPVPVTAGTTYTASYLAPNGNYYRTANYFAATVTNGPLQAPATGGNGVFVYGAGGTMPTGSSAQSNYWVDPIFRETPAPTDQTPPSITGLSAVGSGTSATITWTTDEASTSVVQYGTVSTSLTSTGTGTANVTAHTVTLTGLTAGAQYFYKVTSTDAAGNGATSPGTSASFTMPGGLANDLARGKTVTSTSSVESGGWGRARAVDGILTTSTASAGWSSNNTLTSNHTEYIQVDLGSAQSLNQVSLWPRNDGVNSGYGWPVNFTIGVSTNGSTFTNVATVTNAALPTAVQHFTFASTSARYIRITGTSLRRNPNDSNTYRMQFAEIGAYGTVTSSADTKAPAVTAVNAVGGGTAATVTWTTDEASSSTVQYGTSVGSLNQTATTAGNVTAHTVALTALTPSTVYYYRVISTDAAGNTTTSPVASGTPASFNQAAAPPDTTAPAISAVSAASAGTTSATVTWTTNEASTSVVSYGTTATSLTQTATGTADVTSHSVTLSNLTANTKYYYRVTSADAAGNSTTSPATSAAAASYAPGGSVTQATAAQFTAGTQSSTLVSTRGTGDGDVTLAPAVADEFDGTALNARWTTTSLATGSAVTVSGGQATVSGRFMRTTGTYSTGRAIDATATLRAVNDQWIGFASSNFTGSSTHWAAFHTTSAGGLVAETHYGGGVFGIGAGTTTTTLSSSFLGSAHRYVVDWTSSGVTFSIDGAVVATQTRAVSNAMYAAVRDATVDASPMLVDSLWVTPYAASGTFTSSVIDAGQTVDWGVLTPTATTPSTTGITYQVRSGPNATAGGTGWSAFTTVAAGADMPGSGRYLQYRATLTTTTTRTVAPSLSSVQLGYTVA